MKKQEHDPCGASRPSCTASRSRKVYLYVHGKNGCKEEAERFARYRLRSRLAGAGHRPARARRAEGTARSGCCRGRLVPEIEAVYARMQPVWAHIRLYGVSIGAWLAMQALQGRRAGTGPARVSPVVDMEALITEHDAGRPCDRGTAAGGQGRSPRSLGETLSWPYLCWVREHPLLWHAPHAGAVRRQGCADLPRGDGAASVRQSGAHLTILEGGETLVPHRSAAGGAAEHGRNTSAEPQISESHAGRSGIACRR